MSGLNSAIFTALSGLNGMSEGIDVIGNNLANQTTSGYAVESIDPETAGGMADGGNGIGDPVAVNRAADNFAVSLLNNATASSQAASVLSSAFQAIDQALSGNGDIHGAASTFFGGLSTLASEPSNSAQASTVLSDAQALAGAFQSAAGSLAAQQVTLGQTVQQQVEQVNKLTAQLGEINNQLAATSNDNALLDQQQAALTSLSRYMNISTVPLGSGAVEVTTGGSVLVDQSGAQTVSVEQATPSTPPTLMLQSTGTPIRLGASGGSLGGALAGFTATANAISSIDWYAGAFASLVNQSQAEGLTSSGTEGKPLFSVPPPGVQAGAGNTGSATLAATITNTAALPSNGQGYVLTFQAGSWTATVPGTSQSYALGAGPTLTLNGMNVAITGAAKPGDTFTIDPEPGAASALALTTTDPAALAAADPYTISAGSVSPTGAVTDNNAGTAAENTDSVVSSPATGAAVVPGSYFGSTLQLTFTSASAYRITTAGGTVVANGTWSDGTDIAVQYPPGSAAAGNYWQVNLTGKPATGDILTLAPGGGNSGSNASRMANLWTATDAGLPGSSLEGSILSIIGSNGAQASAASTLATNTAQNLTVANNNLTTVAGVSSDQQATLLLQYQQAYAASAKVISAAQSMFQSLISAV